MKTNFKASKLLNEMEVEWFGLEWKWNGSGMAWNGTEMEVQCLDEKNIFCPIVYMMEFPHVGR